MTISSPHWYEMAAVLAAGFLVVFAGISGLVRHWRFVRGTDAGDGVRKLQKKPILRLGGLPIFGAFVICFFYLNWFRSGPAGEGLPVALLGLGTGIFLLGFFDDLFGVPAKLKLIGQVAAGRVTRTGPPGMLVW
ncbi:MAG: hypothetical protein P1U87_15140 [Verrucomicrobiales bacterium]|nr:hypothetical protein [Verrucomicrobiales bacterium]